VVYALTLAAAVLVLQPEARVDLRVRRGLAGFVAARGQDWLRVDLREQTGAPCTGVVRAGRGPAVPFSLSARARSIVWLTRDTPARSLSALAVGLEPVTVTAIDAEGTVLATAVAPRVEVAEHLCVRVGEAALPPADGCTQVVLRPDALPTAWPALFGLEAISLGVGPDELPAPVLLALLRHRALGGRVCAPSCESMSAGFEPSRPAPPLQSSALRRAVVCAALVAAWLALLAAAWPRLRGAWRVVALALPPLVVGVLPVACLSTVLVTARGQLARVGPSGERMLRARLAVRSPLANPNLGLGEGDFWLRREEPSGEFLPMTVPAVGNGDWRLTGFVPRAVSLPAWIANIVTVETPP